MAIRPKEGRKVKFKPTGDKVERTGVVQRILRPEFNRHLNNTQYTIICDDDQKTIIIDSVELVGYAE